VLLPETIPLRVIDGSDTSGFEMRSGQGVVFRDLGS
jgi:hypothetical protein